MQLVQRRTNNSPAGQMLALQAVLNGNEAGQQPQLRLRGYMVGNGVVDQRYDGNALVPFAYGKSLIR